MVVELRYDIMQTFIVIAGISGLIPSTGVWNLPFPLARNSLLVLSKAIALVRLMPTSCRRRADGSGGARLEKLNCSCRMPLRKNERNMSFNKLESYSTKK